MLSAWVIPAHYEPAIYRVRQSKPRILYDVYGILPVTFLRAHRFLAKLLIFRE